MKPSVKNRIMWIQLALCISLAGLTNHSLGDIVYRKVTVVDASPELPKPQGSSSSLRPQDSAKNYPRIVRIDKQKDSLVAVIDSPESFPSGAILEAQRQITVGASERPGWVTTGLLKIQEQRPDYALALALEDGTYDSSIYHKASAGIMVGDRIVPQNVRISSNLKLLPTVTLLYKDLFLDPKSFPLSFELSDEGLELLKEQARIFLDSRVASLVIEAHTDSEGDRQANQMESYQRALTIRQILVDDMGFDPERILAIGLGESEPMPEANLPGKKDQARRIILKVNGNELR